MKLEEIAHQSAEAALAGVAHLDPPGVRPPRSPGRMPVLVGLALLVLVGSGVWFLGRDEGGSDPGEQVAAGSVGGLRLELADLPEGYVRASALDGTESDDESPLPRFFYFGDASSDDPYAERDLLIVLTPGGVELLPLDGDAILVRGTEGRSGEALGFPGTGLVWVEPGGEAVTVGLFSRSLDTEGLLPIAEGLNVQGAMATLGGDTNLDLLGTSERSALGSYGSWIFYTDAEAILRLTLSSGAADVEGSFSALLWWDSDAVPVEVNGRRGILGRFDPDEAEGPDTPPVLLWSPAAGQMASLSAFGDWSLDADLVALAESGRPVDDATWTTYLAVEPSIMREEGVEATAAANTGSFDELYGVSGDEVDGEFYPWALGSQDGEVCVQLISESRIQLRLCSSARGGRAGQGPAIFGASKDNIAMVLIVADSSVDSVRESSEAGTVTTIDAAGNRWFVWVGPSPAERTFTLTSGSETTTLSLGSN